METTELRSKEEVIRDIEATRIDVKETLRATRNPFGEQNAVRRFWKATKNTAAQATTSTRRAAVKTRDAVIRTKDKVVTAAHVTDETIRGNVYTSVGVALCVGTAVGFLVSRRLRAAGRK
jgi:ElaB/YqjD/DUF883 family membrane-anchored ribosome-binding protein